MPERGRGTNHHSVKRGVSAVSLWMAVLAPVKRRSSPATSSAACLAVAKGRGGIASTLILSLIHIFPGNVERSEQDNGSVLSAFNRKRGALFAGFFGTSPAESRRKHALDLRE